MTGVCLTCGVVTDVEAHHVGGRRNWPGLVVPVCPDCHRVLTSWALAAGIELSEASERAEVDRRRALLVGGLHVVQLSARRAPDELARPELWAHAARAISRLLDAGGPCDRAGRWLPDSTIMPTHPIPVAVDPSTAEARVREMIYLAGALLRLLGDQPPVTAQLCEAIAADPRPIPDRLLAIAVDDHAGPALAALITTHLDAAHRVMLWLLSVEDWEVIDERLLDEARVWLDTGTRLLHKVVRVATNALEAGP